MPKPEADPRPSYGSVLSSNVLKMIGKGALLDRFTTESDFIWTDLQFPYGEDQLPEDETEADDPLKYTRLFIEKQEEILASTTPSRELIRDDIRSSRGSPPLHIHVADIETIFRVGEDLGDGRVGTKVRKVKLVVGDSIPDIFAMKQIPKPAAPRAARRNLQPKSKSVVEDFKAECDNMRKCNHDHLVSFHASFTEKDYFGIIMSPVAQSSLQHLLLDYTTSNQIHQRGDHLEVLEKAFGCLLEAVRYLHDANIKHRDLKPKNVLLSNKKVLICDFGSAYDWESTDREESTEASQAGTRKYKAPEVLQDSNSKPKPRHNRKADIYSLGCIFLEMHSVIRGKTLDKMTEVITGGKFSKYNATWTYASVLSGIKTWLDQVKQHTPDEYRKAPATLITRMVY